MSLKQKVFYEVTKHKRDAESKESRQQQSVACSVFVSFGFLVYKEITIDTELAVD